MSNAFSRPWSSISRQKRRIWMRMCRVMSLFVVFEGFGKLWTPFGGFGIPFLWFSDLGGVLEGFWKGLQRFGDPILGFWNLWEPSKMPDLDAYVSSYCPFRRFSRFWKVVKPFLMIWDSFSLIFRPARSSWRVFRGFEKVWGPGRILWLHC